MNIKMEFFKKLDSLLDIYRAYDLTLGELVEHISRKLGLKGILLYTLVKRKDLKIWAKNLKTEELFISSARGDV